MVEEDERAFADADKADLEVLGEDPPGRVFTQIGPWGLVPIWVLDAKLYLPGVPDPSALKNGDEQDLTGSELRVYVALRSYTNAAGYARPFVSTLAERAGVSKSATERAIGKFKRLGWVTTKRKYRDDGSIRGCDYWVRDVCPEPRSVTGAEGVPARPRVPHPRDGGNPTREAAGAKNTPDERTNRTHLGSDQISTTSDRSAHSGGGDTESKRDPWAVRDLNQLREGDFELFRSIVGEHLRSTGVKFTSGTWSAKQIYLGMMKWKLNKKTITWPGSLVEKIDNDGFGDGVEYFLAAYGIDRVDA